MPTDLSILKEVYVASVRIDPVPSANGSTAYAFDVRSRRLHPQAERSRLMLPPLRLSTGSIISLRAVSSPQDGALVEDRPVRATHTVKWTYSECRRFNLELLSVIDSSNTKHCTCISGACPFWTMFRSLDMSPFPRKTLIRYESRGVRRQRVASLQSLFTIIFQLLETYRDDYFLARNLSSQGCQMLSAIESFLGLTPEVSKLLHDRDVVCPLRLNLHGWHSDRKNLYFRDDTRQPLTTSDETINHDVMADGRERVVISADAPHTRAHAICASSSRQDYGHM